MNSIKKISFIALFGLLTVAVQVQAASSSSDRKEVESSGSGASTVVSTVTNLAGRALGALSSQVVSSIGTLTWAGVSATVSGVANIQGPTLPGTGYKPTVGMYALATIPAYMAYTRMLPRETRRRIGMVTSGVTSAPKAALFVGALWTLWRFYNMNNQLANLKRDTEAIKADTTELKIRAEHMQKTLDNNEKQAQTRHKEATANLAEAEKRLQEAISSNNAETIRQATLTRTEALARHAETGKVLKSIQEQAAKNQADTAARLEDLKRAQAEAEILAKLHEEAAKRRAKEQMDEVHKVRAEMQQLTKIFNERTSTFTSEQRAILRDTFNNASAQERPTLIAQLKEQTAEQLQKHAEVLLARQREQLADAALVTDAHLTDMEARLITGQSGLARAIERIEGTTTTALAGVEAGQRKIEVWQAHHSGELARLGVEQTEERKIAIARHEEITSALEAERKEAAHARAQINDLHKGHALSEQRGVQVATDISSIQSMLALLLGKKSMQ